LATLIVELTGEHFRRQYLLYIIQLTHEKIKYYYVGQTGDTKEITARPVFRRLAAHLEDRKSTQNQVYQYIAHNLLKCPEIEGRKIAFTEKVKQQVEEFLINSKVTMFAYHLEPFITHISRNEHNIARRKTLQIEKLVIRLLQQNGKNVMNKKTTTDAIYINCPYPTVLQQVVKDFSLRLH
jgi:hypothetical protein